LSYGPARPVGHESSRSGEQLTVERANRDVIYCSTALLFHCS